MTAGVVVVGSGVVGLAAAVRLAEAGHAVEVVAADPWEHTTSRVAGGLWLPYLVGGPHVLRWAAATARELVREAAAGAPGVRVGEYRELAGPDAPPLPRPDWAAHVGGVRPLDPAEVPSPWAHGQAARVPIVDMARYLPWLVSRLESAGGRVRLRRLAALEQAGPAPVVINCTGLGSAALAGDSTLQPIRGQVVVVENRGMDGASFATDDGSYAIAHDETVVLGGTAEVGVTDLTPDPATTEAILGRAGRLLPPGPTPEVVAVRVGLRPWRPEVRLEEVRPPSGVGRLVHCYGHGGAGVTLAWGCADEVAGLLGAPAATVPAP
ncbi:MAG: FAD-dependent oxidoreductase [Acidimicrobiales bacterium]